MKTPPSRFKRNRISSSGVSAGTFWTSGPYSFVADGILYFVFCFLTVSTTPRQPCVQFIFVQQAGLCNCGQRSSRCAIPEAVEQPTLSANLETEEALPSRTSAARATSSSPRVVPSSRTFPQTGVTFLGNHSSRRFGGARSMCTAWSRRASNISCLPQNSSAFHLVLSQERSGSTSYEPLHSI